MIPFIDLSPQIKILILYSLKSKFIQDKERNTITHFKMAWVPSHLRQSSSKMHGSGEKDPTLIAKSLLNKLSEEKFLAISLEMKEFFEKYVNSSEIRNNVSKALLTKAIREPNYSKLYTELAISITTHDPEFKSSLLQVLQTLFTKLCNNKDVPNRTKQLKGCSKIIGEFYNHELISQRILFLNVANYFLEEMSEDSLGALCTIITVSRDSLCASASGKESLNLYINKLRGIYEDKTNGIGSRMRFLVLNAIEGEK